MWLQRESRNGGPGRHQVSKGISGLSGTDSSRSNGLKGVHCGATGYKCKCTRNSGGRKRQLVKEGPRQSASQRYGQGPAPKLSGDLSARA